jgi:hypothetical protein
MEGKLRVLAGTKRATSPNGFLEIKPSLDVTAGAGLSAILL